MFRFRFTAPSLLLFAALCLGAQSQSDKFPKPQMDGGMPLMDALKARKTTREFAPKPLPEQTLANLLWAAAGVNRPESGKRTAPSAMNWQEVDVYVASADGVFLYNSKEHALEQIVEKDLRTATGASGALKAAPINLIYVIDWAKMDRVSDADKAFYSAVDTGLITQNVYLFCASEGLGTVVRAGVKRDALAKAMGLRPEQKIALVQTVGYSKE